MTPLIQSPDDIARLDAIARSWVGTPYAADGAVKGAGVSCSNLPHAILAEYGHGAPAIPRRAGLRRSQLLGTMRDWLNDHPDFYVPISIDQTSAGDVVLMSAGMGHLAMAIDREDLIQSWQTIGAHIVSRRDPAFLERAVGIWRPI